MVSHVFNVSLARVPPIFIPFLSCAFYNVAIYCGLLSWQMAGHSQKLLAICGKVFDHRICRFVKKI